MGGKGWGGQGEGVRQDIKLWHRPLRGHAISCCLHIVFSGFKTVRHTGDSAKAAEIGGFPPYSAAPIFLGFGSAHDRASSPTEGANHAHQRRF